MLFGISLFLPESSESTCKRIVLNIARLQYEKSNIQIRELRNEQILPSRVQKIENEMEGLNKRFDLHCEKYKKHIEKARKKSEKEFPPGFQEESIINTILKSPGKGENK